MTHFSDVTFYELLRDQGGLIGGILALGAGGLAYWAGVQQATVARRQIAVTIAENAKERLRSGLIAHQQLIALLTRMDGDLKRRRMIIQTQLPGTTAEVEPGFTEGILLPELSVVWGALGFTERQAVQDYFSIDAELRDYKKKPILNTTWNLNRLTVLIDAIEPLLTRLNEEASKISARLSDVSDETSASS